MSTFDNNVEQNLKKNLELFWNTAQLNFETTQKALEETRQQSTEQFEKVFALANKAQNANNLQAVQSLFAEASAIQKAALEQLAKTNADAAKKYFEAAQKEAAKYCSVK